MLEKFSLPFIERWKLCVSSRQPGYGQIRPGFGQIRPGFGRISAVYEWGCYTEGYSKARRSGVMYIDTKHSAIKLCHLVYFLEDTSLSAEDGQ